MNESPFWRWLGRIANLLGVITAMAFVISLSRGREGWSALSEEQRITAFLTIGLLAVLGVAAFVAGLVRRLNPRYHAAPDRGRVATALMLLGSVLLVVSTVGIGFVAAIAA